MKQNVNDILEFLRERLFRVDYSIPEQTNYISAIVMCIILLILLGIL